MLQITFVDNARGHDDISVEFNDRQFTCDSYYFLIDDAIPDGPTTAGKARSGLQLLLTQWRDALLAAPNGIIYLPFDFSDQYTRCLQCKIQGRSITLCAGWSHIEGWRILPSNIAGYSRQVTDFQSETPAIDVQRDVFLQHITDLIGKFQGQKNS